jgi:AsmA protein
LTAPTPPPTPATLRRRRWLFFGFILFAFLVLLLTPPLISVSRLQRRIASSMSASLGRPVHLDRATLHLLPVPGFTLQNLVVSEDPAFGAEPVIRANKVEITLRLSSLWRRQVELSSVHFEVDDNGSGPSLNLVRNQAGQWNLQSLLMHAAQVQTAPTAQTKPGPAPRFPYVEATGGRINLKLADEKTPFSLTDADFALWLPEPDEWRLRLVGKPARTDRNVPDTGSFRLEGSLHRAPHMADVPVDLHATWRNVPLGEASTLVLGHDAGWRGSLALEAALAGPLGAARLTTSAHLNDLRRADFIPLLELHLDTDCNATLDTPNAVLHDPTCSLDTPAATGSDVTGRIVAIADQIAPLRRSATGLRLGMTNVPNTWLLDWARLFSQRIPPAAHPGGVTAGSITWTQNPASANLASPDLASRLSASRLSAPAHLASPPLASWLGEFHTELQGRLPWDTPTSDFLSHPVSVTVAGTAATLQPLSLMPPGRPALLLSANVTPQGYILHLSGTAAAADLDAIRTAMPPFGDGLDPLTPHLPLKPQKLTLTCTRPWTAAPTCTLAPEPPTKPHNHR